MPSRKPWKVLSRTAENMLKRMAHEHFRGSQIECPEMSKTFRNGMCVVFNITGTWRHQKHQINIQMTQNVHLHIFYMLEAGRGEGVSLLGYRTNVISEVSVVHLSCVTFSRNLRNSDVTLDSARCRARLWEDAEKYRRKLQSVFPSGLCVRSTKDLFIMKWLHTLDTQMSRHTHTHKGVDST